jgi:hypothetical protein
MIITSVFSNSAAIIKSIPMMRLTMLIIDIPNGNFDVA